MTTVRLLAAGRGTAFIVRDGPLKSVVSVRYKTVRGSARPDVDYVPINETLVVFNVGEREKPVHVISLDSDQPVPDLTFYIVLYDAIGN